MTGLVTGTERLIHQQLAAPESQQMFVMGIVWRTKNKQQYLAMLSNAYWATSKFAVVKHPNSLVFTMTVAKPSPVIDLQTWMPVGCCELGWRNQPWEWLLKGKGKSSGS